MEIDEELMNEARAYMGMPPLPTRMRGRSRSRDFWYGLPSKQPESADASPAAAAGAALKYTGKQLRAAREEQGVSLSDLEDETGISRGRLSRLETLNEPNPTIGTLCRIAKALGLQIQVTLVEVE